VKPGTRVTPPCPPDPAGHYRRGVQTPSAGPGALRRGVLAVSVVHDIALEPVTEGVRVGGDWDDRGGWSAVPWPLLTQALDGADPESAVGKLRLRDWLNGRVLAGGPAEAARERAVALALPRGHPLHPGPSWVVEPVLGGLLDLGIGVRSGDDDIVPLPATCARHAGLDTSDLWGALARHRDVMSTLTVERLRRDGRGVLRPIGGCDVLTLLSGSVLREYVAAEDGTGMRALAVPMRSRGWFDLARIDPAYVGAAATATDPEHQGLLQPLLVTADEVGVVPQVVTLPEIAQRSLADPAGGGSQLDRNVLYR
jgi:hypothetical protein